MICTEIDAESHNHSHSWGSSIVLDVELPLINTSASGDSAEMYPTSSSSGPVTQNHFFPETLKSPVTVIVEPSHVRFASPSIELASVNIAISLSVPLVPSNNVEPHTRESISSVLIPPSESRITTELSTPVPMLGANNVESNVVIPTALNVPFTSN